MAGLASTMAKTVSNKVAELRVARSKTQQELGESVGVTRQTIIALERGNYIPSLLLALKIANFFKKKVEDIFIIK